MKKIIIKGAGSYDQFQFQDCEDLKPSENEVLIAVRSIGVNFADVCIRLGVYESAKKYVGWPITPGFEVSGKVQAIGAKVTKYSIGQEVVGFTLFNGYATQVSIKEEHVLPLPKGFTLEEGGAFPAVFFTAYHALHQQVVLQPNSKILIHSAAGGVGTALVQLCKAENHFTVGVIGSSQITQCIEGMEKLIQAGKIKPIPITQIPFQDVAEAHRLIESGQSVGKLTLIV